MLTIKLSTDGGEVDEITVEYACDFEGNVRFYRFDNLDSREITPEEYYQIYMEQWFAELN